MSRSPSPDAPRPFSRIRKRRRKHPPCTTPNSLLQPSTTPNKHSPAPVASTSPAQLFATTSAHPVEPHVSGNDRDVHAARTGASQRAVEEREEARRDDTGEQQPASPAQALGEQINRSPDETKRRRKMLNYEPVRTILPRSRAGFAGTHVQWQTTAQTSMVQTQPQIPPLQSLSPLALPETQVSPAQPPVPHQPSCPLPQVQSLPPREMPQTQIPPTQSSPPQVLRHPPPPSGHQLQVQSFSPILPPQLLPHVQLPPPHMPLSMPPSPPHISELQYAAPPPSQPSYRSHELAATSLWPERLQPPPRRPLLPPQLRPRPRHEIYSYEDDLCILSAWRSLAAEYTPFVGLSFARRVTAVANAKESGTVLSVTQVRHRMHVLRKAYVTTLERSIQGLIPQGAEADEYAFYNEVQDIVLESRRARKEMVKKHGIPNNRAKPNQPQNVGTRALFLGGVRIGEVPREADDDILLLLQRLRNYPLPEQQQQQSPPPRQQQQQASTMARPILPRGPLPAPIPQAQPSQLLPGHLLAKKGRARRALGALSQCSAPTQPQAFAGPATCARAERRASTANERAYVTDVTATAELAANGDVHTEDGEAERRVATAVEAEKSVNREDTLMEAAPEERDDAFMEAVEREFVDFIPENDDEGEPQILCDEREVASNEGAEQDRACGEPEMVNDEDHDRERDCDEEDVADDEGDIQERVCDEAKFASEGQSVKQPSQDDAEVANNEAPAFEPSFHEPEVTDDEEAVGDVYRDDPEIVNQGSATREPYCDGHHSANNPCANGATNERAEGPGARCEAFDQASVDVKFADGAGPVQTHKDCTPHDDDSARGKRDSGLKETPTGHTGDSASLLPEQYTLNRKRASALDTAPQVTDEGLASPPSSTTAVELTGGRRNKRRRVEQGQRGTSDVSTGLGTKRGAQAGTTGQSESPARQADCWPGNETQADNVVIDPAQLTYSPVFAEARVHDPTRTRRRAPGVSQNKDVLPSASAGERPRLDSSQIVRPAQDADSMDAASSSEVLHPVQRSEPRHVSFTSPATAEVLIARRAESKARLEAQKVEWTKREEEIRWDRTVRLVEELRSMIVLLRHLKMPGQAQKCVTRVMDLLGTQ